MMSWIIQILPERSRSSNGGTSYPYIMCPRCDNTAFNTMNTVVALNPRLETRWLLHKIISRTSAVSSTNFGSILIFASCVVGTCNILPGVWVGCLLMGGVLFFCLNKNVYILFFSTTIMVGVGITLGGECLS